MQTDGINRLYCLKSILILDLPKLYRLLSILTTLSYEIISGCVPLSVRSPVNLSVRDQYFQPLNAAHIVYKTFHCDTKELCVNNA